MGDEVKLMALKMARVDGFSEADSFWMDYEVSAMQAIAALHIMTPTERCVIMESLPNTRELE